MPENFQQKMDQLLKSFSGARKSLLLHSCCAPCSTHVLEMLSQYFDITIDYYNPNIDSEEEYILRSEEQKRFVANSKLCSVIRVHIEPYCPKEYYHAVQGLTHIPEGGARCEACFRLRLEQAAKLCLAGGYDYFCTTLSISPHKNAVLLNQIGIEMAEKYGVQWLFSDFKKKNGFRRSIELSQEHGMYRQNYCGCIFSKRERERAALEHSNSIT